MNPMIEKLRKLIAHERSARSIGNLLEAEAFAAKIQDLLTAHKLEMSEVDFQEREKAEPVGWEPVDGTAMRGRSKKSHIFWRMLLANTVAEVNGCIMVCDDIDDRVIYFVGRTSDRALTKMLYVYLVELGEELCFRSALEQRTAQFKQFADLNHLTMPPEVLLCLPRFAKAFSKWMKNYRDSWKVGFADAVANRLKVRYAETIAAHQTAGAIIHIKKDALAAREFLAGKTKHGGTVQASLRNEDGLRAGKHTGEAVNLSPHTFAGATGRASRLLGS